MRVLRVYHAGRDPAHRRRDRALALSGVDVTLVVPTNWPDHGAEEHLTPESFDIVELDVLRAGDVNRHRYADSRQVRDVLLRVRPDVLDLHEEPVSVAARQWLTAARSVRADLPVALYTAQNLDKRFPPPFAQYERRALQQAVAMYPCSLQAASVARGKGFLKTIQVLPLGIDPDVFRPGSQRLDDEIVLGFVGRLVPEKGFADAVRVLAAVREHRPVRLHVVGSGPDADAGMALARTLGVADAVELTSWCSTADLAKAYRGMHLLLVPSRATATWVEQFGRVMVEAKASGTVVAGYRSGAIAEVGGSAAVLVPEGDVQALASAVLDLLADRVEFCRRRESGLVEAATCNWTDVAKRQAELYTRMLAAHGNDSRARKGARLASARRRRSEAAAEFGAPARVLGQTRPFALPLLRRPTAASRALGGLLDLLER